MSKGSFVKKGYKWVKMVKIWLEMVLDQKKKGVVKGLALDLANTEAPLVLKTCHIVKYYML
jgi:hypothetical protein